MSVEVEVVELDGAVRKSRKRDTRGQIEPAPFRHALCVCEVHGRVGVFQVWHEDLEFNVDRILAQPQAAERMAELGCHSIRKYVGHLAAVSQMEHKLRVVGAIKGVFSTGSTYHGKHRKWVAHPPDGPPRASVHEWLENAAEFDRNGKWLRPGDRVHTHFDPAEDDPQLAGEGVINGFREDGANVEWAGGECRVAPTDSLVLGKRPAEQADLLRGLADGGQEDGLVAGDQEDLWGMEP